MTRPQEGAAIPDPRRSASARLWLLVAAGLATAALVGVIALRAEPGLGPGVEPSTAIASPAATPTGATGFDAAPALPSLESWPGVAWAKVESRAFDARSRVLGLTAHGETLVGWGEAATPDPAAGGFDPVAALWRSTDGWTWARQDLRDASGQPTWPVRLAVGEAGLLAVLVQGGENPTASLVASRDGLDWAVVRLPEDVVISHVVATGDGWMALGNRRNRPIALTVANGVAAAPVELPGPPDDLYIADATVAGDKLVAVGSAQGRQDWDGAVWQASADGWALIGPDDPILGDPETRTGLTRVVRFAGGLYAVGFEGVPEPCAERVIVTAGPITADVCPGPPSAAWLSDDGGTWRDAALPDIPGQPDVHIHPVTAGGDGLLALVTEGPRDGPGPQGLWTSADGVDWRRIGDGPAGGGVHMGVLPGRVVVLGVDETEDASVWIGTPARP